MPIVADRFEYMVRSLYSPQIIFKTHANCTLHEPISLVFASRHTTTTDERRAPLSLECIHLPGNQVKSALPRFLKGELFISLKGIYCYQQSHRTAVIMIVVLTLRTVRWCEPRGCTYKIQKEMHPHHQHWPFPSDITVWQRQVCQNVFCVCRENNHQPKIAITGTMSPGWCQLLPYLSVLFRRL